MSKELVGQVPPYSPPIPGPPEPQPGVEPTKVFLADLKGDKGDPGVVDSEEVEQLVEDYLEQYPVGLYVETFVQSTPSDEWVINHSLPFAPAVTIIDSAGTRIETEIVYDSPTQIRSIASAGFSGIAYLS